MSHLRPTCPSIPVLCLLGLTGLVGLGVLGCSAAKEAKERAITEAAIGRWSCAEQDEGLTAPGTIPRFASFTLTIEPGEWTAQGDTWTNQGSWTVEGGKLTVQNDDEGIGATVTDASGGEISRDSTSLELLQRSDDGEQASPFEVPVDVIDDRTVQVFGGDEDLPPVLCEKQ